MGEKVLVDALINDTVNLVKKLDELSDPPTFVAWYYYDDADEWRLLLAGPSIDPLLQKQEPIAYGKVIDALSKTAPSALSVSDLKLVPTSYSLLQALKFLISTGPQGMARAHFRESTLNGIFVKEVLIMRSA